MIERFHKYEPYSLGKKEKEELLFSELMELTKLHREKCQIYAAYLDAIGSQPENIKSIEDIPFLPIRIFKELEMKSIPNDEVFKTMMSSGTSGQRQAKIYLNKETAILQQKVLLRLLSDFVGHKRKPMLIIDSSNILTNRSLFNTRGATIMGLDFMAKKMVFVLNQDMTLNLDVLSEFISDYGKEEFIIFGFTFAVWQYLFDSIEKMNIKIDLSNGYLLTSGGWKKLSNQLISNEDFKERGSRVCGITKYVDHYGMAEQTGCIYAECEYGHLHASIYSDIIIRRYEDFKPCRQGEKGFIQVLSSLPRSYPGHSLLTEDEGMILGEDDCPCGRKGKYIKILGRIQNAEIRGCSDTYAANI